MRGHGRRRPSGARRVAAKQRGAGARSCEVPCRSDRLRRTQPGRDRDRVRLPEGRTRRTGGGAARRVLLPRESELRFHWIEAWLDALDADELRELVLEAWRMVVPQRVARGARPTSRGPRAGPDPVAIRYLVCRTAPESDQCWDDGTGVTLCQMHCTQPPLTENAIDPPRTRCRGGSIVVAADAGSSRRRAR